MSGVEVIVLLDLVVVGIFIWLNLSLVIFVVDVVILIVNDKIVLDVVVEKGK